MPSCLDVYAKLVTYTLQVKRVIEHRLVTGIADGAMMADGEAIYIAKDLRVGLYSGQSKSILI